MSKHEWERGEIVIPKNQWAKFKKALRDAYNNGVKHDLEQAAKAIAEVKKANKGKRNVNWEEALECELNRAKQPPVSSWHIQEGADVYPLKILEDCHIAHHAVCWKTVVAKDGTKRIQSKLVALKKKDFPLATGNTMTFDMPYAEISLDDRNHAVIWNVPEGNYACERAGEAYLAQVFFKLLESISWSRNSGGYISGNDEFNRESREAGDGANLLKQTFGPLGKREAEFRTLPFPPRRRRR